MPLDTTLTQSQHGRAAQPTARPASSQAAAEEPSKESQPKPNDARTVEAILKSMGVDEFDPRVTHQLLELLYRHVSNILLEARQYSEHADKQAIDSDDVRLAINSRSFSAFAQPPPRQVIAQLANERNAIPLPPVQDRQGIQLPKAKLQLTHRNYMLSKINKRHRSPAEKPRRQSAIQRQSATNNVITIDGDITDNKPPSPRPPIYARQPMEVVNIDFPSTASNQPNASPSGNPPARSSLPASSIPAAPHPALTAPPLASTNVPTSAVQQPAQNSPPAPSAIRPQPPT